MWKVVETYPGHMSTLRGHDCYHVSEPNGRSISAASHAFKLFRSPRIATQEIGIQIPMLPGFFYIIQHNVDHMRTAYLCKGFSHRTRKRCPTEGPVGIRLCESESPISQRSTRQVQAETRIRIFAADLHARDWKKKIKLGNMRLRSSLPDTSKQ